MSRAKQLSTSSARSQFADIVSRAEYAGECTVIYRHKKPVAAVIPISDLKLLERLEDELDIAAARKARKEKGKKIPWAQAKKELGL
jgi:prevent-host-death family protein